MPGNDDGGPQRQEKSDAEDRRCVGGGSTHAPHVPFQLEESQATSNPGWYPPPRGGGWRGPRFSPPPPPRLSVWRVPFPLEPPQHSNGAIRGELADSRSLEGFTTSGWIHPTSGGDLRDAQRALSAGAATTSSSARFVSSPEPGSCSYFALPPLPMTPRSSSELLGHSTRPGTPRIS